MRAVLVVCFALFASVIAFEDVQRGYHEEVGIPLASKIKALEDALQMLPQEERIVGGAISVLGAHPYFSVCGASLLSANRAVTAAHCWFDGSNQASLFTAILGSNLLFSGGIRIATNQVIMHPQWTPSTFNSDIAMIYLPTPVSFTTLIQLISIPNASELWETFVGQWAMACGFGRTSDGQLGASSIVSEVAIQVISNAQCQQSFGPVFIQQSTVCTNGFGGVGICQGDSGGPLVVHYNGRLILIGVSSFVADAGCQRGHPSAFARVTSFRDFVLQHL